MRGTSVCSDPFPECENLRRAFGTIRPLFGNICMTSSHQCVLCRLSRLQQELQEVRALIKNSNRTLLLRRFHVRGFESFCQSVAELIPVQVSFSFYSNLRERIWLKSSTNLLFRVRCNILETKVKWNGKVQIKLVNRYRIEITNIQESY